MRLYCIQALVLYDCQLFFLIHFFLFVCVTGKMASYLQLMPLCKYFGMQLQRLPFVDSRSPVEIDESAM